MNATDFENPDLLELLAPASGAEWLAAISAAAPFALQKTSKLPPGAMAFEVSRTLKIPLADFRVRAGFPSPAESYMTDAIDLNELLVERPSSTYCVRAIGDSMNKAGIDDGDLLVVDRSKDPVDNDIVIMQLDNEFTVKRLRTENGQIWLEPDSFNPVYEAMVPGEGQTWLLAGVVRHIIKDV